MRITLISQYFFPEQFSNNEIARWLSDRGHDVGVVCGVPNYPVGTFFEGYDNRTRREETWQGVRIHRARTVARGQGKLQLMLNYITFPLTASRTLRKKVGRQADVSFVSMPSPIFQALAGIYQKWRHGVPLVYWVQDIWPESAVYTLNLRNPLVVRLLGWLCGWIYRRADLVLVQSAAFPAMIERFGVPPERIRVFPNTAPATYEPRQPDPDSPVGRMIPPGRFRLMFAGNIGESQDFDTYIAAAERLRDAGREVAWVIIGSGRDEARVKQEIARRGLSDVFHFLGRHPEAAMPEFFAHASAMLVGLKSNPIFDLTVPYKVQCYMACGRPIVASLSGEGARIVTQSRAGGVATSQSPDELAAVIGRMFDASDTERRKMGEAGRRFFEENYAAEKVYGDLERWLAAVARGAL